MLSRNDMTVLMRQVDVGKALDLLTMFKEAGKEKIDVRTIMDEAAPKIKDYAALVEKLEQLAGNHGTCNVSEFSAWDEGASREPVPGRPQAKRLRRQTFPHSTGAPSERWAVE